MLATATRDGRHLIAVVLNATLHSTDDATLLLNYGFSVHPTAAFGPWKTIPTNSEAAPGVRGGP
jgi:D-alanyl-D-alanine carboxypeptidase